MPGVGGERLQRSRAVGVAPLRERHGTSTGWGPSRDERATSRHRDGVAATATSPRGVRLTFGAPSTLRTGLSGYPAPLRPLAGPWGLPHRRWPRPTSSRPTRLAPLVFAPPAGSDPRLPAAPRFHQPKTRRASHGVRRPSAHDGIAGPLARGFQPPLRSAPRVSTLSAASSPRTLPVVFHTGALMGFALQGFTPPGPSLPPSEGPTPPRRWAAAGYATTGARATRSAGDPRPRPRGFPSREYVPSGAVSRASGGPLPSWASSSLGRSRPRPRRRRSRRPSPHGLPDGHRAFALDPPRPFGVFDGHGPGSTP